jgi:hypothetical protein
VPIRAHEGLIDFHRFGQLRNGIGMCTNLGFCM